MMTFYRDEKAIVKASANKISMDAAKSHSCLASRSIHVIQSNGTLGLYLDISIRFKYYSQCEGLAGLARQYSQSGSPQDVSRHSSQAGQ